MNFKKRWFFIGLYLLLTACYSQNTDKQGVNMKNLPSQCQDKLHKVISQDDLMKQMYDTAFLDDCLNDIDPMQLQKIWEIPVLTFDAATFGQLKTAERESGKRNSSLYADSALGIYVLRLTGYQPNDIEYSIFLSHSAIEQVGTLFPNGRFPDFLPPSIKLKRPGTLSGVYFDPSAPPLPEPISPYRAKKDDPIQFPFEYLWIKDVKAIGASTQPYGSIKAVTFYGNRTMIFPDDEILKNQVDD